MADAFSGMQTNTTALKRVFTVAHSLNQRISSNISGFRFRDRDGVIKVDLSNARSLHEISILRHFSQRDTQSNFIQEYSVSDESTVSPLFVCSNIFPEADFISRLLFFIIQGVCWCYSDQCAVGLWSNLMVSFSLFSASCWLLAHSHAIESAVHHLCSSETFILPLFDD